MCYFLFYESILDTVLFARDKWLVKDKVILFPDKAAMYISAIEDGAVKPADRIDFWNDVALYEPVAGVVDAKAVVINAVPILSGKLRPRSEQE